jgi:hypothetical protein
MKKAIFALSCLSLTIPCLAITITVDDNSPADFNNIQAAINDANNGDTVLVADGIYTGNGNRDIDFLGKAITVKSENGPENCIIDCYYPYDCNTYDPNGPYDENDCGYRGFYFINGEELDSVLDGFTITNAHIVVMCYGGAAIYISDSSPTIKRCILTNNHAELSAMSTCFCYGGAIYIGQDSAPIITNCVITDNSTGGWGFGGGICCDYGSDAIIQNCIISRNSANGPYIYDYSHGGGICAYYCDLTINNCTISDNIASEDGGGIYSETESYIYVHNCIIWGNSPDQIYPYDKNAVHVGFSNIQGGWPQIFPPNIDVDPCFADPNNGDYHLKSQVGRWNPNVQSWVNDANTSPCIDAGALADWKAELWPHGKKINMGAYGGTPQASMSLSAVGNIADLDNSNIVDHNDLKLFTEQWLNQELLLPEDLDRNSLVNLIDYAVFANNWLWQ